MKKIKTDLERVLLTIAAYVATFCFCMAMLTVCLGVLTKDPVYTWWSIGLCAGGCFLAAGFLVERIQDYFDE